MHVRLLDSQTEGVGWLRQVVVVQSKTAQDVCPPFERRLRWRYHWGQCCHGPFCREFFPSTVGVPNSNFYWKYDDRVWQAFPSIMHFTGTSQPHMDVPGDCVKATCLQLLGTPMDALHDAVWLAKFPPTCSILYFGLVMNPNHVMHVSIMALKAVATTVLAFSLTHDDIPMHCRSMTIAGVAFLIGCVWQVAAKR